MDQLHDIIVNYLTEFDCGFLQTVNLTVGSGTFVYLQTVNLISDSRIGNVAVWLEKEGGKVFSITYKDAEWKSVTLSPRHSM